MSLTRTVTRSKAKVEGLLPPNIPVFEYVPIEHKLRRQTADRKAEAAAEADRVRKAKLALETAEKQRHKELAEKDRQSKYAKR